MSYLADVADREAALRLYTVMLYEFIEIRSYFRYFTVTESAGEEAVDVTFVEGDVTP